ncbi:MAG: sulfatase [Candidatus Hinthialibacter antarcticus]|nr:sulfatase [Candidatus Hinthialibacter antarcticus]
MKIDRRNALFQLGALAAGAACSSWGRAANAQDTKTNVVFILIDDLGWADLGCYGHKFHETPNIDRLAAQGMRFTDAYAACPVCSPTRASIMSGQYPAHVGVIDFITGHWRPYEKLRVPKNRTQHLPLEIITLGEAMQSAGYKTGVFGKWHLGGREHFPDRQGFDEMLVTGGAHFNFRTTPETDITKEDYQSEVLTDRCVQFIQDHKDKPFCAFLHHYAVHIPLQAREKLIRKYEQKDKPADGVNNPIYAAMMEHVDQSVGRVLDTLDDLKLADDTMVIFFSDNGGLRQHFQGIGPIVSTNAPLRDEKGTLYEGGIRVPLIVRWPGAVKPGSECNEPVSSVDFYPTFLDVEKRVVDKQSDLDGVSLMPWLKGEKKKRGPIFWHYPIYHHSSPASAVRDGKYKLIEFFEDGHLELYDLKNDMGESKNLANEKPEITKQLHQKLIRWRESIHAQMPENNPDFDPARRNEWGTHPDRN